MLHSEVHRIVLRRCTNLKLVTSAWSRRYCWHQFNFGHGVRYLGHDCACLQNVCPVDENMSRLVANESCYVCVQDQVAIAIFM